MGNDASRLIDQLDLLSSDKTSPSVQARHAWDSRDKSGNIDVKNDGFVVSFYFFLFQRIIVYLTLNTELRTPFI